MMDGTMEGLQVPGREERCSAGTWIWQVTLLKLQAGSQSLSLLSFSGRFFFLATCILIPRSLIDRERFWYVGGREQTWINLVCLGSKPRHISGGQDEDCIYADDV
jgi:hypothetical protein